MQNLLRNYDYIILDFSLMFVELRSDLIHAINSEANVIVAPTFDCECEQLQEVVPYRIANRYKKNHANVIIDSKKKFELFGLTDTYGLACHLTRDYQSVLVIEANYVLDDRIVLSGLSVDVYNLLKDKVMNHEDYIDESASRTIDKSKTPLEYCSVESGDFVYTDGSAYILADPLDNGLEAQIYKIKNNNKLLAKIFRNDEDGNFVLTSQKLTNINVLKEINDHWDVLWLALPTAVLYADNDLKKPIGYMMPYFNETKFLSQNSLFFSGAINAKFPEHNETCVKDVLDICIKFVRQILFLALNDIHISDYNDKNFAIPTKNDNRIVMVDTDSFSCEDYVSECITYAACLNEKHEINNRSDLLNLCDKSLYSFIFTRLMLDSRFFPIRKSEFRLSASNMEKFENLNSKAKWKSIPPNLQELFIEIFEKNNYPSINVLLYELEVAYGQSFAKTKYRDIYNEVLEIKTSPNGVEHQEEPYEEPVHKTPQKSIQYRHHKRRRKRHLSGWVEGLIIFFVSLVIGSSIWWFGFGHPEWITIENTLSKQLEGTPFAGIVSPQLQRFETDNGYYLSYLRDQNGYGEYYWDIGDSYKGNFTDGVRTGSGSYNWADGRTYSGGFVDGKLSGNGIYIYTDGSMYCGNFENDLRNGQGIFYNNSGKKVYEGSWKDGLYEGEGTYYFPNNVIVQETWMNGTYKNNKTVDITNISNGQLVANGYWSVNIFYGSYYENDQWYTLP